MTTEPAHENPTHEPTPETTKPSGGCLGILLAVAGLIGLIYAAPALYRAVQGIAPIDRQTIILSAVIIYANSIRRK
jgi:hypothetical protein